MRRQRLSTLRTPMCVATGVKCGVGNYVKVENPQRSREAVQENRFGIQAKAHE